MPGLQLLPVLPCFCWLYCRVAPHSWGSPYILGLLALATLALVVFCRIETRVSEPMLPFSLFREKIIGLSLLANFLIGAVMIGASTYVPMFVQGVMGGSAVNAGAALAPMSIGWPLGSTICGRLLLRVGYRKMTTLGMVFQVLSIFMLLTLSPGTGQHSFPPPVLSWGRGWVFVVSWCDRAVR